MIARLGAGPPLRACKGGNDEVGITGGKSGRRLHWSRPLQRPQRWASHRPMRTLNA